MKTTITAAAAIVLLGASGSAALAQTRVSPVTVEARPSVSVSYADLDLSEPAGMRTLEARLRGAARAVCGSPGKEPVGIRYERKACLKSALSSAWDQVAVARDGATLAGGSTVLVTARAG